MADHPQQPAVTAARRGRRSVAWRLRWLASWWPASRRLRWPSTRRRRIGIVVTCVAVGLVGLVSGASLIADSRATDRARAVLQERLADRWDDSIGVTVSGALLSAVTGRAPHAVVHVPLDVLSRWAPQGAWSQAQWSTNGSQLVLAMTVTRAGLDVPIQVGIDLSVDGSAVVATPAWIGVAGTTIDASRLGDGKLGRLAQPVSVDVGVSGVQLLGVEVAGDGVDLDITTRRTTR